MYVLILNILLRGDIFFCYRFENVKLLLFDICVPTSFEILLFHAQDFSSGGTAASFPVTFLFLAGAQIMLDFGCVALHSSRVLIKNHFVCF